MFLIPKLSKTFFPEQKFRRIKNLSEQKFSQKKNKRKKISELKLKKIFFVKNNSQKF